MGEETQMRELRATFYIHRNDMFWECCTYIETEASPFEWFQLKWIGYNDDNWWDNVAPDVCVKEFIGDHGTKKKFRIDFHTMLIVELAEEKAYE